jgi:hypothetical protein
VDFFFLIPLGFGVYMFFSLRHRRKQRLATAKAANEDVVAAFRRRDDW